MESKSDLPLGIRSNVGYQTNSIRLGVGDAMFVVSNGVDEAQNAEGTFYTIERLNADLRVAVKATAKDLVRLVTDNVNAFTGSAPKADDVTALALRWHPRQPEAQDDPGAGDGGTECLGSIS